MGGGAFAVNLVQLLENTGELLRYVENIYIA